MRIGYIVALGVLVGCSGERREVEVRFEGHPAPGAFAEDTRRVVALCPVCRQFADRPGAHPCGARLRFRDRVTCGFCRGTKACAVCAAFETSGRCRFCGGMGKRGMETCFGCGGSGVCAACGGSSTCDACRGAGVIAIPWMRGAPPPFSRPAGNSLSLIREDLESPLLWVGESLILPRLPGAASPWTVVRAERGERRTPEKVAPGDRFTPAEPGSYAAISGSRAIFFDVIEAAVRSFSAKEAPESRRLEAAVAFKPPLRGGRVTRWEWVKPSGVTTPVEGSTLSVGLEGWGLNEAWPVIRIPGLPERRGPQPARLLASILSIGRPPGGRARAEAPIAFEVTSAPPLPEATNYEWTRFDASGNSAAIVSRGSRAEIEFPSAGRYRLEVRAAGNLSAPIEIASFRVWVADAEGRAIPEATLAHLEGKAVPNEAWLASCSERIRIMVEDPSSSPPAFLSVSIRARDGSRLGPPVSYALAAHLPGRATRPLVLFADRADIAVPLGGTSDGRPEDPSLFALPQGRLDVTYGGWTFRAADIGPMAVQDIPVRVLAVGGGFPSREELEKVVDRRLDEVNAIWAPLGRRFTRSSLELAEPARGLLLIRGRSGGVDLQGQPSRLGVRVDGVEVRVQVPWSATPAAAAQALGPRLGPGYRFEILEGMLPTDRDSRVLWVHRSDGGSPRLEALHDSADISQSATVVAPDLSQGCEAAKGASRLSLNELGVVLAGRRTEDVTLYLVRRLRGEAGLFKVYPDGCLASWEIADGSGRYPYALAHALGLLLLPRGWSPRAEDTLFHPVLSPVLAADAHKRIGRLTAAKIREGGRVPGAKNDDSYKGNAEEVHRQ